MTSPLRRYISAFPRCTVTDSSCIAQRTNAPLGMRPLSAAMSGREGVSYWRLVWVRKVRNASYGCPLLG